MMIVIFCVVFGFIIASLFMSVVEMAIDTTLLSFCKDCKIHGGKPKCAAAAGVRPRQGEEQGGGSGAKKRAMARTPRRARNAKCVFRASAERRAPAFRPGEGHARKVESCLCVRALDCTTDALTFPFRVAMTRRLCGGKIGDS